MRLIAITGGIGSGKSVVSQLLRVMGYEVYDCDSRAKWLMTHDTTLRRQLCDLFGPDTYLPDGSLDKARLAAAIFGHDDMLAQMNACVHPAVARDLRQTAQTMAEERTPMPGTADTSATERRDVFFYESAILYESGFDLLVPPDEVWCVVAPEALRLQRAMARDHATEGQVQSRMNKQMPQDEKARRATHLIHNDPDHSVIQQVRSLLS